MPNSISKVETRPTQDRPSFQIKELEDMDKEGTKVEEEEGMHCSPDSLTKHGQRSTAGRM